MLVQLDIHENTTFPNHHHMGYDSNFSSLIKRIRQVKMEKYIQGPA